MSKVPVNKPKPYADLPPYYAKGDTLPKDRQWITIDLTKERFKAVPRKRAKPPTRG